MKLKIGIFDSGIGGFTILNSLLKTRKDVEVFYLADTKRIPYGNKNSKEIRLIAKEICNFFVDKNLDALLVACNTTNACALDILVDNLKVPCFDLINSVSGIVDKQIIEELILGCSHYPLIYDFLRKKLDSNIKIIDPSLALIKKFNESFPIPKTDCHESISFENVKFFVTSERDEFSNKVKFWLGINKEIRLVNLRSNV